MLLKNTCFSLFFISLLSLYGCSDNSAKNESQKKDSTEILIEKEKNQEKIESKEKLSISNQSLPFKKDDFKNVISDEVFSYEKYVDSSEVFDRAIEKGGLFYASKDNWIFFESDSFNELERSFGEEIPGRYLFLSWVRNAKNIEYKILSYNGSYEKRSRVFSNRFLFGIDKNTKKIVMYHDWKRQPIKNLLKERSENKVEYITQVSEGYKDYVNNELLKENPFSSVDEKNRKFASEITNMTAKMADNKIPLEKKPQALRAPHLWGRIYHYNQEMADFSRINIDEKESVDMNYDILKSTFFGTFNDIEDYLDMQIPMREKQINWMMTFEDRYFVLTEGPERKHAPYEYMIFVMDANTHEQVMIILWNHDEPDP